MSIKRVQLVTARDLDREREEVQELARGLGIVVDARVNDPGVPGEKDLRRVTFHVETRGRREPVLDIFNAGSRELVPYTRAQVGQTQVRVGALPVLARFRLVDFWTVQLLFRMGAVSATFARGALADAAHDLQTIGRGIDRSASKAQVEPLFPGNFVGVRVDAAIAGKRAAKAARNKAKEAKKRGDKKAPRAFYPPYFSCPASGGAPGTGVSASPTDDSPESNDDIDGWYIEGLDYERFDRT